MDQIKWDDEPAFNQEVVPGITKQSLEAYKELGSGLKEVASETGKGIREAIFGEDLPSRAEVEQLEKQGNYQFEPGLKDTGMMNVAELAGPKLLERPIQGLARNIAKTAVKEAPQFVANELGTLTIGQPKAPKFFYKLEKTIEDKMGPSATKEQVEGLLREIKPEERQISKIDEFLAGKEKINKEELLNHLQQNRLELPVTVRGGPVEESKYITRDQIREGYLENAESVLRYNQEQLKKAQADLKKAKTVKEKKRLKEQIKDYKQEIEYNQSDIDNIDNFDVDEYFEDYGLANDYELVDKIPDKTTQFEQYKLPGGTNYEERLHSVPEEHGTDFFEQPHWEEPNVLYHVRKTDRLDAANNKHLFLEELQSDWHQAGRQKGYRTKTEDEIQTIWTQWNKARRAADRFRDELQTKYDNRSIGMLPESSKDIITSEELEKFTDLTNKSNILFNEWRKFSKQIPNAPLKKTWHENALKNALHEAAEKDYSHLSWTTGAQQAERYRLKEEAESGMKGFYDKIIPEYLNKFAKKYGVKVETSNVQAGKTFEPVHSLKITPEMRKDLLEQGLPFYATGGFVAQDPLLQQVKWDDPQTTLAQAPGQSTSPAAPINLSQVTWDEDKYGTTGQQALGLFEQAAKGVAGPLAVGAEEALSRLGVPGISAEERLGREEALGAAGTAAQVAGFLGSMATGVGEAALLAKGSSKVAQLLQLGQTATRANQAATLALRGAIEASGFAAGDELTNWINNQPASSAGAMLAHVGLSSLLGGAIGGVLGGVAPKFFADQELLTSEALNQFKNHMSGMVVDQAANKPIQELEKAGVLGFLKKKKPIAQELVEIGERHQWPVLDGMISDSKTVQAATDAMLNGPPTVANMSLQKSYQEAADAVAQSVNKATETTAAPLTETEVGNAVKATIQERLMAKYEPIQQLYDAIEPYREIIQVSPKRTKALNRTISDLITEKGLIPGTERYNYVKSFADHILNVDNLKTLATFKTEARRSSGPLTKDLMSAIQEKMTNLEERVINNFAQSMKTGPAKDKIMQVLAASNKAKKDYAAFSEQLNTLGRNLGKKKVYGVKNFEEFLEDLNPQTLIKKAFNKQNTEFSKYLWTHFPETMNVVADYYKNVFREQATKEGVINSGMLLKQINKLPDELRDIIYTPQQRQVLSDATKYLESFPKSYNPSGTSHISAMRAFFEQPTGAAIANIRDAGILAFLKALKISVPGSDKYAGHLISTLGPAVLDGSLDARGFKTAATQIVNAAKQKATLENAAKAVFHGSMAEIPHATDDQAKKLDEHIDHLKKNPNALLDSQNPTHQGLPNHAEAMTQQAIQAMSHLDQVKPKTQKQSVLDRELPMTPGDKAQYMRALKIAEQPMTVLRHIKNGTLLPTDVITLQRTHPEYFKLMSDALLQNMTDQISKNQKISYPTRQSLSLFFGSPLDSTLQPQVMQSIQATFTPEQGKQMEQAASAGMPSGKHSMNALTKLPQTLMTSQQNLQRRMNK